MSAFQPWTSAHQKADDDEPTRYERKKESKAAKEDSWRTLCRVVNLRDRRLCRACGRHCDPHATTLLERAERHHVIYRSAGGVDESWNVALICGQCHNDEHKHRLKIDGNADVGLTIYRKDSDGSFYIARQETAPHVLVPRD